MPPEDTTPAPPPIADYELLKIVGRGSYGDVWLARGATGLFRAVKVVWRDRFNEAGPYEREFKGLSDFMRLTRGEARQLALLHVGRDDAAGFFYYVMEVADDVVTGRDIDPECYEPMTLRVIRSTDSFLPADETLRHGIDLAQGLAELHAVGLIHRDIKPSNVILVDGRPKLADIGLVSVAAEAMTFVGTEGFVPPEGPGTRAADIFSLGKVLYEIATGCDRNDFPRLPGDFGQRNDRAELLELNEVIVKACAHRASERYADAESLLAELRLLDAGKSVRRLRFAEAGLLRARKWILLTATIAIVAGAGAWVERRRANVESEGRRAAEAELAELTRRSLYHSSIAQAQRYLETNQYGAAREALRIGLPAEGDTDLRGFEWYALQTEARGDPAVILRESGPPVTRLVYSPDGQFIAVDNVEPTVEIYHAATRELVQTLTNVHRIAGFSPDSSLLIGTTPEYGLQTWAIDTGRPQFRLPKAGVNRPLQTATDQPWLLYFEDGVGEADHRIAIWDFAQNRDVFSQPVPQLVDGNRWLFYNGTANRDLSLVYLSTYLPTRPHDLERKWLINPRANEPLDLPEATARVGAVTLAPDGQSQIRVMNDRIALETTDGIGTDPLWSHPTARFENTYGAFSPDGSNLLFAGNDQTLIRINRHTGDILQVFRGSSGLCDSFAFAPDGAHIVSSDRSGEIRIWEVTDAPPGQSTARLPEGPNHHPVGVRLDDITHELLVSRLNGRATLLSTGPLQVAAELTGMGSALWLEAGQLWQVDTKGCLVRHNVRDPADRISLLPENVANPVTSAAISPDGRWILMITHSDEALLWDRTTETLVARRPLTRFGFVDAFVVGLAITNDALVISMDSHQMLKSWDLRAGQVLAEVNRPDRPLNLTLSPRHPWLVTSLSKASVKLWRLPDLEPLQEIENAMTFANSFAFHPRQPVMVSGTRQGVIRIFDIESGRESPSLNFVAPGSAESSEPIFQIQFSRAGDALVAVNRNGLVKIWQW